MTVNRHGDRELERCECCEVLDRRWRHVEVRQDGQARLDVKLCRRCATAMEDALLLVMRRRHDDPVTVRSHRP